MMYEEFISHLKGVISNDGKSCMALCCAHDDHNPSLSVAEKDGKILIKCFAGCSCDEILTAVGLSQSDLYPSQATPKPQKLQEHIYEYRNEHGGLLYCKIRVDYDDGSKKFFFRQPNGRMGVKGVRRVPYNLPAVINAETVIFVEGEKCSNAVNATGWVGTTLDAGAKSKWLPEYAEHFKGKEVIIIPDNDVPGMEYAKRIAQNIPGARIVKLPGLAEKADIYDWLKAGHSMDEIVDLPGFTPDDEPSTPANNEKETRSSQAEKLLGLVKNAEVDFFHSETNDVYATLPIDGHTEIWMIEGKDFNLWLHGLYYRKTGRAVRQDAVQQTISVLSAKARFERPEPIELSNRVAKYGSDFWYDLTNPEWQAIKITPDVWTVIDNPPILFSRYRHQKSQVMPQPGGDIKKILNHINLKDNHLLFLCWLVCCFVPEIPHPMPIFHGEKGAAKSTTSVLQKALIDPSVLETLTLQNNLRTLAVNLQQHWFLPFDNVSHIREETSDTLCRAITGGGIQQRKLCTNADDYIFTFQRCLAINGINNVANRPDLLDRSILIELERIPEGNRRELAEVLTSFEADRPAILGGIFNTLSKAMSIFATVKLEELPRMADFARWGYAIGEALGGHGEAFLAEYIANLASQNNEVINSDPVATLIVEHMQSRDSWTGMVSKLLIELSVIAPELGINPKSKNFPAIPNVLSRRLTGIKSNLEAVGITFKKHYESSGTIISLRKSPAPPDGVKANDAVGSRHGDKVAVIPNNGGNTVSLPYPNPLSPNDFIENGGNGDEPEDYDDEDFELVF